MIRKIIKIDEEKCNGCGACAAACHEGAIEMINGKARLTREDYCDGLGDCLPACPTNAITFEEREAPAYDEAAVLASKAKKPQKTLETSDRFKNADFYIVKDVDRTGREIIIVDDIITTGYTMGECASTLNKCKPASVKCATFAITVVKTT